MILRKLKPRHIQFCELVAAGMPQTTAYMTAFACKRERTASSNASRLLTSASIGTKVNELQQARRQKQQQQVVESIDRHRMTKEFVLAGLRGNYEYCADPEHYDAAGVARSLELIGKELGLFVTKVELGRPGEFERLSKLTDEELAEAMIEEMAKGQKMLERLQKRDA